MDTVRPSPSSSSDALRIGPYRTLRELGRGGQAIVWLAEDVRIGRQVALKVLPHLGPGGAEALARFRREAEVAARLEHPAICAVLEADLDGGAPYIAMRYVPGETLAREIARRRERSSAPPDRAELVELARRFETLARALHVAHEAGIVHRDIKPANLMTTPEGEPVVLDFGLARQDDGSGAALSVSGEVSGTPAYMSPEQMTGRAKADRRTDVWSLGVALYEAATLAHPFASATREALFQAILESEPADPRALNPAIDRDLATILETACAKERDQRYQTAADFAEDLRRWRANEPIRARPIGRVERLARWAQRKPALAASLAAVVVLALGASALLAYGVGAASRAATEASLRAAAENAQQGAESAQRAAEEARAIADAARAKLERIASDRRLFEELDELNMQAGTLQFGLDDRASVGTLTPRYLAAFRAAGIDLERGDAAALGALLTEMRERDVALAETAVDSLRNVGWAPGVDATLRQRVFRALETQPEVRWPELEAAAARWGADEIDEFDPLLTDEALRGRSSDQLYNLAGALLLVPARLSDAQTVLERALRDDPGSFRLHFLVGALGFMQMAPGGRAVDEAELAKHSQRVVKHMEIAVALRPRSGFVRAMLATAQAMTRDFESAGRNIEASTKLEPENALVWLFKARFYSYSPLTDRAVAACKKALELEPELAGAKALLAQLETKKQ